MIFKDARNSARPSRRLIVAGCAVAAILAMTADLRADRLNDKDVKALLERVDQERDRFEDQLDGKVKSSVLRGPGGETNVARFLDDLQENVDKMKERFKPEYAASAEVTTVLRQASDIQKFMSGQPANFNGASEWNRLNSSLNELAAVYGTTLPLPDGHQARRMNDREVKMAAEDLSKTADQFKKDLDATLKADKSIDAATRQGQLNEIEQFKREAKALASVVGDGRPASGEAKAVLERMAKLRALSAGRTLSATAQTSWQSVESGLTKVAAAFAMPARLP